MNYARTASRMARAVVRTPYPIHYPPAVLDTPQGRIIAMRGWTKSKDGDFPAIEVRWLDRFTNTFDGDGLREAGRRLWLTRYRCAAQRRNDAYRLREYRLSCGDTFLPPALRS